LVFINKQKSPIPTSGELGELEEKGDTQNIQFPQFPQIPQCTVLYQNK